MLVTSWQWALGKVYGLTDNGSPATVLGTGYHAGVEAWLRRRLTAQRDATSAADLTFGELLDTAVTTMRPQADMLDGEQWALHRIDPGALEEQLEVALDHWWGTPIPDGQPGAGGSLKDRLSGWRIIAVEPYFRSAVPVSVRPIHGYIDVLAYDPDDDEWVVVDHKTAGSFGRWPKGGDGHELEAAVYHVGASVAPHLPTWGKVRMEWQVARKEAGSNSRFEGVRVVTRHVDRYDELWMGDRIVQADRIVADGAFETNPGWNLCSQKWCAFYRGCQVTGDLSPRTMAAAARLGGSGGPSN